MPDSDRIPQVLEAIRAYWEHHPYLRLGQLISVLNDTGCSDFYVEDSVIESAAYRRLLEEADDAE